MFPQTYLLLQNEGALMQGCLKSSFATLRHGENGQRGPLYSACFNYGIGLERLLKIILLMHKWHCERKFPDNAELKNYGHNIQRLYQSARDLFSDYRLQWQSNHEPDPINRDLLSFFSDFANGSRYFNLDGLAGLSKGADPIRRWETLLDRVYDEDVPEAKRSEHSENSSTVPQATVYTPPEECESACDSILHDVTVAAALPHLCWRLVQLLLPMNALLIAITRKAQQEDSRRGGQDDPSIPNMEEFLDFVCNDKNVILTSEDWP
jgi:hypothetical protein